MLLTVLPTLAMPPGAQEQAEIQTQITALLNDVAQIQDDQTYLAEKTGVSENISGVEMRDRIVRLEEDAAYFEEVTGRLERYVDEMLRTMLSDLGQGRLVYQCMCHTR